MHACVGLVRDDPIVLKVADNIGMHKINKFKRLGTMQRHVAVTP